MMKNSASPLVTTRVLMGLMVLAALSRLLPHPPNFTPLIALAVFGGAAFSNRTLATVVTLGAMLVSDVLLGLHGSLLAVYGALLVVVFIGSRINLSASWSRIAGHSFAGALIFFVLSNFAVWLGSGMYPATFEGLVTCYTMALPFFGNSLAGTAVFGFALFGLAKQLAKAETPSKAAATV